MKRLRALISLFFLVTIVGFSGCGDDDPGITKKPGWHLVFEDPFDGTALNTTNWTQVLTKHLPYSLTGNGELQIDGDQAIEGGALYVYNIPVSNRTVRLTAKFRTTLIDPVEDDVEFFILLNRDGFLENGYGLLIQSDPVGSSRDCELSIIRIVSGINTEPENESMGGTQPQITAGNDYIIEGINDDGTRTLTIKNGNGTVLKSISVEDSTHSGGKFGFASDVNVSTSEVQSVFFDRVKIEEYE